MKYMYTAVFCEEDEGRYSVTFPDVEGCATCGDTLEDALYMAEDALSMMLTYMEDNQETIPTPTKYENVDAGKDIKTLVHADTQAYRRLTKTKSVRRTVSIPEWMDEAVKAKRINCSRVLQQALESVL